MPVFKGSGKGDIYSPYFNIPYKIISFYISNKSATLDVSNITVYIEDIDNNIVAISSKGFTLKQGQAYIRDTITKVNKNERIYIVTDSDIKSGEIYYYFSIE